MRRSKSLFIFNFKMKLFLKQILLFGILFLLTDQIFFLFVEYAPEKENDKRLQYVLDGRMNKEMIILGSSRGANDLIASQLEDLTGLSTYNLSYRGSDVTFHKYILESLIKFNKNPEKIILIIDNSAQFTNVPSLNFRYDRLFPLKNYSYINNTLIKANRQNRLSEYFWLARIKKKDFDLSPKELLPINKLTKHGSKINSFEGNTSLEFNLDTKPYEIKNENPEKLNDFLEIQEICRKNKIKLIYVFVPNFGSFEISFFNRFKNLVRVKDMVFVYDTTDQRYQNNKYFRDSSHLNAYGAELLTEELSLFLNKNNTNLLVK